MTRALLSFSAAIVAATLAASTAEAQDDFAQTFSGSFRVAEKAIPLPAGEWHLVGTERTPATTGERSLPAMRTAILARLDGTTVIGLISASVNEAPAASGWGITRDCTRSDLYMAVTNYHSP